jgi:hypothetical protein
MDKNRLKKNLQRLLLVLASLFIIIIFALTIFAWQLKSGNLLQLSSGQIMTRSQYLKTYPPEGTIFEAKNTPQEVYAEFYRLIMAEDYEKAVLLIDGDNLSRREMYLKIFSNDSDWLKKFKNKLPQELDLTKLEIEGNNASYNWDWADDEYHSISFSKNQNGFWEIKDIF